MLESVIRAIKADISLLIQVALDNIGLKDSNLLKTMKIVATNDGDLMFDIIFNDYVYYVEHGRGKGKRPPVDAIEKWCARHNIPTDNKTLWAIRTHIANEGLKPRPFLGQLFDEIDKHWDSEWGNELFDEITKIIDNFFNN